MAGTIVSDTLQDGAGNSTSTTNPIKGSAKAWIQFSNTGGGGGSISAYYNISSMTYTATGKFAFNFTNAMPSGAYCALGQCNQNGVLSYIDSISSTSFTLGCYTTGSAQYAPLTGTTNFAAVFSN